MLCWFGTVLVWCCVDLVLFGFGVVLVWYCRVRCCVGLVLFGFGGVVLVWFAVGLVLVLF